MPPTLDYESRRLPQPRRPGSARYWLWYYGGPRYALSAVLAGVVAFAAVPTWGVTDGVLAGVAVFAAAVRVRPGRREW